MRYRCILIGVLAAMLVEVSPALATNQSVTVSSDQFTAKDVTVFQGENVTWHNTGGTHNVHFDDDSFTMPDPASSSGWTVSRTFNTPGTFRYYCDLHGGPGGSGMSGTVAVTAATGYPRPNPPNPVTESPQPRIALFDKLPRTVRVTRTGIARLRLYCPGGASVCSGTVTLSARAKLRVAGASKKAKTEVVGRAKFKIKPGRTKVIQLRLSRNGRRRVLREKRLECKASGVITRADGQQSTATKKVTLKAPKKARRH